MDFIVENYIWFIIGALVILMTVVGYIAEKTDFASKKRAKNEKEGLDQNQIVPNNSVPVENMIPVTGNLNNNFETQNLGMPIDSNMETQNLGMPINDNMGTQPFSENLNSQATVDGVPAELFAPLNSTDTINIDNVSPEVDINESVEPVNLSVENNVPVVDADGVSFEDLYKTDESNEQVVEQAVPEEVNVYDNMESSSSEVTPIEEEVSSDPLFAANVAPLSIEHDEAKEQEDPWAETENDLGEATTENAFDQSLDTDNLDNNDIQPQSFEMQNDIIPESSVENSVDSLGEPSVMDNEIPNVDMPLDQNIDVNTVEGDLTNSSEQMVEPLDISVDNLDGNVSIESNELNLNENIEANNFGESQQLVQEDNAQNGEQPIYDWQFEQIFPEDPVIINKDSVDSLVTENTDSNANEDVWKF